MNNKLKIIYKIITCIPVLMSTIFKIYEELKQVYNKATIEEINNTAEQMRKVQQKWQKI